MCGDYEFIASAGLTVGCVYLLGWWPRGPHSATLNGLDDDDALASQTIKLNLIFFSLLFLLDSIQIRYGAKEFEPCAPIRHQSACINVIMSDRLFYVFVSSIRY